MATVSFSTQIDLSQATDVFNFTDTSNYAGQGIPLADVNGSFTIVDPSGLVVYENTDFSDLGCDIDVLNSLQSQQVIAFVPVLGVYVITYSVFDSNTLITSVVTQSYNNSYVAPTLEISQTVDCIKPIWGQADITDYVVNGVSPTTKTTSNKLFYPVGSLLHGSPVTTPSETLSTLIFFNGTQTSELIVDLQYDFIDGLQVIDRLQLDKEFLVNCTYYCSILCCIIAQEQLMTSFRGNNLRDFEEQERIFVKVNSYIALIRLAIECGNGQNNQVSFWLDEIRTLTRCTSDCDCSSDDNSRVIGFGAVIGIDGKDGVDGIGVDGDDGVDGVGVIFNSTTIDTPVGGSYQSLKSFIMDANTLPNAGDAIELLFTGSTSAIGPLIQTDFGSFRLQIDSSTAHPKLTPLFDFLLVGTIDTFALKATITRVSATTVMIAYSSANSVDGDYKFQSGLNFIEELITVSDLTLNSNLIDVQGFTSVNVEIVGKQLMITKLLTNP